MATLPSATTRLDDESGGLATGTDLVCVLAPVLTLADGTPRLFTSASALYDTHGYSPGLDYLATHIEATGKPGLFVPLTIGTEGAVGRVVTWNTTGTSVASVAAGTGGAMEETDGIVKVAAGGGGTRGTDQIMLELSCDGGRTYKPVRLGTATSYTIPYFNLVVSFGAGTFVAGETLISWHSTAPLASGASITAAKTALAAQQRQVRSWILIGDLSAAAGATEIRTAVNAYETTDERYCVCKVQLRDRNPAAAMSKTTVRMTGNPNVTFAEVGATGDTITRSAGSFVTDGFVAEDLVTVAGSTLNDFTAARITAVSALVLTLDTQDLVAEGPVADVTITGTPAITFAEVGATGDTITRSRGSWVTDGFRADDNITIAGSVSNDQTTTAGIVTVTALVITLDTDDLAAEVIGAGGDLEITAGETDAIAVAALETTFATVTSYPRLDIGYGRGAMLSPVTGWSLRRPVQWADSILSYQRDIALTTWWKDLGSIQSRIPAGFDLQAPYGYPIAAKGAALEPYDHDERTDGGCLSARFTCARTWGNGPLGAFIAQSLTRADDGSKLGQTHNMFVSSLAQTIVQATTENFAGATLVLEASGVATTASLKQFESKVNGELQRYLLSNIGGDGQRSSYVAWTAATDDDLSVADAVLHGTLALKLLGTIVHISTSVKVS